MRFKRNYFIIPLIIVAVAWFGSYLTSLGMDWYGTLVLNPNTPTGGFISMTWTVIFVFSAISALIFWNRAKVDRSFGLVASLFIDNAILNVLRSYMFFVKHLVGWSIVVMILLWLITLILAIALRYRNKISSILLIPYLLWIIVAAYFAYQIYILNLL